MRVTRFDGPCIVRTSHFLPEAIVSTGEMGFDSPDELIRLTGVRTRHVASSDLATSDLVIAAARPLVGSVGPLVDRVLVATVTPDHPSPATAPLVQDALGLNHVPSMDLAAACAGFVYGLDLAARAVATGDRVVLLGAGECRFRTLEDAAAGVRTLFGDGAGAALIGTDDTPHDGTRPRLRLRATCLGADGSHHAAVRVEAGGSRTPTTHATIDARAHALRMADGPKVFYQAVEGFLNIARHTLEPLGLKPDDIDLIVPHQPNMRILERVARLMRVPLERFAIEVETIGNVGGASVAIALDRAFVAGRIEPGMKVLLLTAGAGFTAGAAMLEATQ